MEFLDIDEYIMNLRNKAGYDELSERERREIIFEAKGDLTDEYSESLLTPRIVALQVIYTLEGGEEGFARLKRQGVKSYAVKGVSVSFEGSDISPAVIKLLNPNKAMVGRFYQ